jgi:superfamily II DNA or RNA helicase
MAKRKKAVQALEGSAALNEVQTIVRRLVEDEDLREGLGRAIESSRRVYDRVSGTKKPAKLLEDKKLQEDAIDAFDAIRSVTIALTGVGKSLPSPEALRKRRKRGGFGRLVVLVGLGGAAAVAASDDLRSKLLDSLFGAEEEFQYSPPPPPAATDAPGTPLSAV